MFNNTAFAPLYAERFLGEGHQPVELTRNLTPGSGKNQGYHHQGDLNKTFAYSDPGAGVHGTPQTQHSTPEVRRTRSNDNHDSPTSTETTSSGDDIYMEEKFDDENVYVRPMMEGSGSTPIVRTRSDSMQSRYVSSPNRQLTAEGAGLPPRATTPSLPQDHNEMAEKDRHIKKLMKKLDKMQRRVVDLEVDAQRHDLNEEHIELRKTLGADDKLGIEIGGPELLSSSDEEKQEEIQNRKRSASANKQPPLGPEAKRLIHKLLNDYEDMEQMYKEEKYNHAKTMRNLSQRNPGSGDSEMRSQAVFKPKLREHDDRFSHISQPPAVFRSSSGLTTANTVAPDPPEFEARQWNYYVDPRFSSGYPGQAPPHRQHNPYQQYHPASNSEVATNNKGRDDDIDIHSDDLSSRHVNSLIDDDVDSHCKAVTDHNEGRQYLRDIILGVNDGLVSTFLLVAGVRGGGFSSTDILLSAIAGSVAGAVSMCAGEYVATKSQNEVTKGEIATEERHIKEFRQQELTEVSDLLELIGIGDDDRPLQKRLIRHYARDPKALLKIMIALELGFLEEEERSPLMAGFVSFWLFLIGAMPSVVPFMIPNIGPTTGFIAAGVATCVTLLIVGAVKTWATKGNCLSAAIENLLVAGLGGAVAYGAGALTSVFIEN